MCADSHPRGRDIAPFKISRDAKVAQFDVSRLCQKQVTRFQVAMNHSIVVGILQCRTYLSSHLNHDGPIESPFLLQEAFNRSTIDQFHHVEQDAVVFTSTVITHDVWMIQTFQNRHFPAEAGSDQRIL